MERAKSDRFQKGNKLILFLHFKWTEKAFEVSQKVKIRSRSKVYFRASMHTKGILNAMGGQSQVNVTKGHQSEKFQKGYV